MRKIVLFNLLSAFRGDKLLRKCIVVFSLCIFSLGAMANNPLATKEQIKNFKNSKTCVVMESGVSFFNAPVKDAIQK
jgi:hypothetical protein